MSSLLNPDLNLPKELEAPVGWTALQISTGSVEAELVDELCAQISQSQVRAIMERHSGVIHISNGDQNSIDLDSFLRGVLPDLTTRGFQVEWVF